MKPSITNRPLGMVFLGSAALIGMFVAWGAISPNHLAEIAKLAFNFTTTGFGWLYLLSTVFFISFCFYLACSPYGRLRLGRKGDRPEFPFFTWIAMLFSAGFGVALVFWGVAEPMSHFASPPPGTEAFTPEAARNAIQNTIFHWSIHQWSFSAVVGLCLGYFQYRKQSPGLISATLAPLIGGKLPWAVPIDMLAVIATATGVATSLGMGIMQISGGLHYVFGLPNTVVLQLTITCILLVLYLISSTTGLQRGIRIIGNFNLTAALAIMLFTFIVGPTLFILNVFTLGLGDYLQNFISMSFRLTPYTGESWVKDWTLFYWAWAIAWSPFVGSFIARVSKGRTIRELVCAVLLVPALVAVSWMAVFGGSALHMEMFQNIPIAEAVQEDITVALFMTLDHFPLGFLLTSVAIVLILTFLITSADSSTFVLGMMTMKGNLNPSIRVKIIWGVLQAGIAVVLMLSSGLQGLQTASLVVALPFSLILLAMCFSLYKELQKESFHP